MTIKAKVVGKVVHLRLNGQTFFLTEEDTRILRAETNKAIERIVKKRKGQEVQTVGDTRTNE